MTTAKELLDAATPLPWGIARGEDNSSQYPYITTPTGYGLVAEAWGGTDARHGPDDAALIVYAVNRLPDYEAAVEALDRLLGWAEVADTNQRDERLGPGEQWEGGPVPEIVDARAALARLRSEVPA